ncbi:MAG TPA: hypothetical protein ENH62_12710 [Marinobacter sp.]|uniref:Uncharacterized protein n=1 Tax=marine sediment metagenome TaxID=412755 RepID=A0A0F9H4T8_9ZZZZ|nr:hypothetical protein [Marinobacter sp.]
MLREMALAELEAVKNELYDILMCGIRATTNQKLRVKEDELLLRKEQLEKRLNTTVGLQGA